MNVYNGAKQAEYDLGVKVNYVWSNWDPQQMIQQFQEAVATRPDGICIMGHPGDAAFDSLIDQARAKGIIVTRMNTTLDKAEAKYYPSGFGYVGAENYSAGHALGAEAVKRFALKKGDRTMVWGLLPSRRGERTKGVMDALKEAGCVVDYIEIDAATNKDPAAGAPTSPATCPLTPTSSSSSPTTAVSPPPAETYLKAAGQEGGRDQHCRVRPFPATIAAIKGGSDRTRHRPAGMAPGLPADPPDLPRQGVRVLGPAHQHRGWFRGQIECRLRGAPGAEEHPLGPDFTPATVERPCRFSRGGQWVTCCS